jgi:hypothetical protein
MKNKKLKIRNSTAEFLIFTKQEGKNTIEVQVADETVWLTQKLIGVLFEKGRSTITEHLQNIFETRELIENSVCRDFRHTAEDGKEYTTKFYNLDAIIAVGFRNGQSIFCETLPFAVTCWIKNGLRTVHFSARNILIICLLKFVKSGQVNAAFTRK